MFSNLSLRHQYAMVAAAGLAVIAVFWIGGQALREPAPISGGPIPKTASVAPDAATTPEVPASVPTEIVVHVVGAVRYPNVLRLNQGDRIQDAIHLAGGPLPTADLSRINLAAKVQDGIQIYVPHQGEVGPASGMGNSPSSSPNPTINLNAATLEDLDTLPGIGPATAQKILDYRQTHGPFRSVDELRAVSGIGPAKLEQIRPFVYL
jgi:competence protein ComEA